MERRSDSSAPLEVVAFLGDAARVHRLPARGAVSFGRAADNTVRIDDPSVSKHHAVLHVDGGLRIEDLGSTNGVTVKDHRNAPPPGTTTPMRRLSANEKFPMRPGDPISLGGVTVIVRQALEEPGSLRPSSESRPLVRDPQMLALYDEARRAAQLPVSVLLLGETGVGKEVLAREIHRASTRAAKPFVARNCATFSATLVEAELFGHERGAFTDAKHANPGIFEAAAGGTVFLDEIGELSLLTQAKLLRVLEARVVERVGSPREHPVDFRLVCATHHDLEADVKRHTFREDLWYRICAVELRIPPLRERRAEIEPLARALLADICRRFERTWTPEISEEALSLLLQHPWPGNVRELRNVLERAVVNCRGAVLTPDLLPPPSRAAPPRGWRSVREAREATERQAIVDALARTKTQKEAAEQLGIGLRTLIDKMEKYGLPRPRKGADGEQA